MHIKIMYNIITFKNVFQYQTAKFNNAKLQSLLHEPDSICVCVCVCVCVCTCVIYLYSLQSQEVNG